MTNAESSKPDKKPCCQSNDSKNLVTVNQLPIYGNPYPPKDEFIEDKPSELELRIKCARHLAYPYVSPLISAYDRVSQFLSTGIAHTQTSLEMLASKQSTILNSFAIATGGLIGLTLARRRGIFKKLLIGGVGFGSAAVACYPNESKEYAQIAYYISKEKIPILILDSYNLHVKPLIFPHGEATIAPDNKSSIDEN